MIYVLKTLLSVAISLAAWAVSGTVHAEQCEMPSAIRYSMVPLRDLELDLRRHQPLFKRISELTGRPVEVVRATSYGSVVEGLLRGSVDIAELGPATYVEAKKSDERITVFATTEKRKGGYQIKGAYYQAMLVVLAKSAYRDLAGLKGTRLALADPASTSGSLLPRKQFSPLLQMPLEKYFASVSYSGSHANSSLALAKGEVDAAFISSSQLEEAHVSGKLRVNDVRILWASEPIPYDPIVYRGQLCEPLKKQIETAFVGEGAVTFLRDLLTSMNAERFVPIDDRMYAGIREVLETLSK